MDFRRVVSESVDNIVVVSRIRTKIVEGDFAIVSTLGIALRRKETTNTFLEPFEGLLVAQVTLSSSNAAS